jgi:hypothetical protein
MNSVSSVERQLNVRRPAFGNTSDDGAIGGVLYL